MSRYLALAVFLFSVLRSPLRNQEVTSWSDFREVHPQFGDDQFDEVILRLQVVF